MYELSSPAWAVPTVLVTSAAPAFAASPVLHGVIGSACKYPGASVGNCHKSFRIGSTWTNTAPIDLEVTFTAVVAGVDLDPVGIVIDGIVYPAGSNPTVTLSPGPHTVQVFADDTNSGNRSGTLTVTATYTYNGSVYTPTASITDADGFPPCDTAAFPCRF